ncbi:MAG: hypothetical protein IKJ79_01705 [Bacteroidaceae bacterium]|nr:hypothetical protein [Bacteroidaceae bacterium]
MKCVLKNIIVTLCFLLFVGLGSIRHESSYPRCDEPATSEAVVDATDFNTPDAKLCHPRTFHLEILQRVPSNTRRDNTANKHNVTYLKAGKVIHSGISYYIYNNLKLRNSVLSELSHRLICLGKLII